MGYCTTFTIFIEDGEPTQDDLRRITEKLDTYDCFDFWGDEWLGSDIKWYDYLDNMCELSKKFPQFRFYVHGDGDESDDLWEDHWQNGMYQHCYAEIPPFDPKQMSVYVSNQTKNERTAT
jgi:hypothetical protein